MCIFYTMMGMTTNAFLFLRDSGFDRQVASVSATILFMGSLVGKISCGFFAEKFGRKKVLICYFMGFIAGSILLTVAAGTKMLSLFGWVWEFLEQGLVEFILLNNFYLQIYLA